MFKSGLRSAKGFKRALKYMRLPMIFIGILIAFAYPRIYSGPHENRASEAITFLGKIANLMDGKQLILNSYPGAGAAYDETEFASNKMGEMEVSSSENFTYAINADAAKYCIAAKAINPSWSQKGKCIYYTSLLLPSSANAPNFDFLGQFYRKSFTENKAPGSELADTNDLCAAACAKAPDAKPGLKMNR
jgi:hypothetical protein